MVGPTALREEIVRAAVAEKREDAYGLRPRDPTAIMIRLDPVSALPSLLDISIYLSLQSTETVSGVGRIVRAGLV